MPNKKNKIVSRNKKGADKILSVYWFVIFFIVASGIFAMVYVFYKSPFDVREIESEIMANKIAECISQQGVLESKWISDNFFSSNVGNAISGNTCQTEEECQKIIGTKLVNIVNGIKNEIEIQDIDESVKQEGVAENFECLILQIAMQESSLQHCKNSQENGNPLYCDGKREEVKSLDNEKETSLGVLQVNTKVHDVNAENFEEGIVYGVKNVLVQQYEENKAGKLFKPTNKVYSSWLAAIRGYNGWGSGGDNNYVENIINQREIIQEKFPEFCSQGVLIEAKKENIEEECNLNFKSEFGDEQYFVQIDFYDFNNFKTQIENNEEKILSNSIKTIFDGNENLKSDCLIQESKDFERQSKCVEKRFYSVDEEGNRYIIKILSAIRKTEKNVL